MGFIWDFIQRGVGAIACPSSQTVNQGIIHSVESMENYRILLKLVYPLTLERKYSFRHPHCMARKALFKKSSMYKCMYYLTVHGVRLLNDVSLLKEL